ncbi:hypothetical protein [Micromonospora sp. NPDC000668]|uniref:hypothetical protein n=1 Tax=Micromonospora sp. NPDC000668 TaxID=3364219 RepID=UPI0036890702
MLLGNFVLAHVASYLADPEQAFPGSAGSQVLRGYRFEDARRILARRSLRELSRQRLWQLNLEHMPSI